MVFQLLIKCGPKEFYAIIDVSEDKNEENADVSNFNNTKNPLKTIQELRQFIAEQLNCDPGSMKIIYKGKYCNLKSCEILIQSEQTKKIFNYTECCKTFFCYLRFMAYILSVHFNKIFCLKNNKTLQ